MPTNTYTRFSAKGVLLLCLFGTAFANVRAATYEWPAPLLEGADNAVGNDDKLDQAFTWLRAQPAGSMIVFPVGTFHASRSISPSGHDAGAGLKGAADQTLEFSNTEFIFIGSASNYDQVALGDTWHPLQSWSTTPDRPYGLDSLDLHTASGNCRARGVAFNVRNCARMNIVGHLSLRRQNSVEELATEGLAGIGSSGGDNSDPALGGSSGMENGSIQRLRFQRFNVCFFGEQYNSNATRNGRTFAGVTFAKIHMQDCWRTFVVGAGHFDDVTIEQMTVVGGATGYWHATSDLNIGTCFLIDRGPIPAVAVPLPYKHLEISQSTVTFGGIYARPRAGRTFSTINAANGANLTIGSLHCDLNDSATSGCIITAAMDDRGHRNTNCDVKIVSSGRRMENSANSGVLGVTANVAATARKFLVGSIHGNAAFLPAKVIADFGEDVAGKVTTLDQIVTHTTMALRHNTILRGEITVGEETSQSPSFTLDPISRPNATASVDYNGSTLSAGATDPNGDPLAYSKVSGPAWLSVSPDGALSGQPSSADVGLNTFTVRATDSASNPCEATLRIAVDGDPSVGAPVTITLLSIDAEDGFVTESAQGAGVGGSSNSSAAGNASLRMGDTPANQQVKSIVSFEISAVPANAVIDSATLRLRRGRVAGTNPFTMAGWQPRVDICSTRGGFGGNSALQNVDFQAVADFTNIAVLSPPQSNGDWAEASITNSSHLAAVNKIGRTQFRVYFSIGTDGDGVTDDIGFWPGEATQAGSEPQLLVTYHVNKTSATVKLDDLTHTYDGTPKTGAVTTDPKDLMVKLTYDGSPVPPTNAGTYGVVATINDAIYYGSATGTLVINPASAAVAIGNASQVYDGTPKAVSVATTPSGLTVGVTYDGSATPPTKAGSYAVAATVTNPNYAGGATGSLVIAKATASVTLGNLAQVYDGAPKAVSISTVPAGLAIAVSYNGTTTAPTNAGAYAVQATVQDPNYTGIKSATLLIAKAQAVISLGDLRQYYDGAPKSVSVATTPADLTVHLTYNGTSASPIYPGFHTVVATVDDANYQGTATETLVIDITALVRHAPSLTGDIDGSVQVLLPESITLNGRAGITGDLLVPGVPALQLNGNPTFGGVLDGPGSVEPTTHSVMLSGQALLRFLVRRVGAIDPPVVAIPPAPAGTRDVVMNSAGETIGDSATLRNLTLNGNAGAVSVPPGTFGDFTANGNSRFVLGVDGASDPAIYNLQSLVLNGNSGLEVIGPVILRLDRAGILNSTVNASGDPAMLILEIASGDLTFSGNTVMQGRVLAPSGTVTLNGNATLVGTVICDRLVVNGTASIVHPPSDAISRTTVLPVTRALRR